MDLSWVVRARWRLVGAWMWPAFVVLAVADGVIGHALPIGGDSETVIGGIVLGLVLNLIAVVLLARPLAMLLRGWRRDLPVAIARNYSGTLGVVIVTLALLAIGYGHHAAIAHDRSTMRDAASRAAAWIGDHAPTRFRADADELSSAVIQSGVVYRECVADATGGEYCVVVNESRPVADSVTPAGSESNQTFDRGLN